MQFCRIVYMHPIQRFLGLLELSLRSLILKAIYYVAGKACCFVNFFIQTFRIWKVKLFVWSLIGKRKRMGNDLIIVWLHITLTTWFSRCSKYSGGEKADKFESHCVRLHFSVRANALESGVGWRNAPIALTDWICLKRIVRFVHNFAMILWKGNF